MVKAASMEELEERTEKVRIIGKTHNMDIVPHSYRQLDALNTSLPTGARFVDTMRTITSEELSIFIPFNVQETVSYTHLGRTEGEDGTVSGTGCPVKYG